MTNRPLEAPTATELAGDPVIKQALRRAWLDSEPHDPARRHEEGGWIYMSTADGKLTTTPAAAGAQASIDLHDPPVVPGSVVVGKFHTHPNPSAEGWDPGPSVIDRAIDDIHGVPDLIVADDGLHFSGPECRRGGLAGPAGYPA